MKNHCRALAVVAAALLLPACGRGTTGGAVLPPHVSGWAWMTGSPVVNSAGTYGTLHVPAAGNIPGARHQGATWADASGNVWFFGGEGWDGAGVHGQLGDLWKFDGATWTWKGGSSSADPLGVYGTKGVAASTNVPGGRSRACCWVDGSGNFWLYGGYGFDETALGYLNDLWKFDGTNWTWVAGGKVMNASGVYGTRGVAAASNVPGGRGGSVAWRTTLGSVFLFGGQGYDKAGTNNILNDLWIFDGTNWTWLSGSDVVSAPGSYGTSGVPSPTNVPGARSGAMGWRVGTTVWLFGGVGLDAGAAAGHLCDVWTYDGTWTWMAGTSTINSPGVYGTKGTPAATNHPGGRYTSAMWKDAFGIIWTFWGSGLDSVGTINMLSDLWAFDGATWIWISGPSTANAGGTYGSQGTIAPSSMPGARRGAIPFMDAAQNLWFFGGLGNDASTTQGRLNDVWRFTP
jgi:galactose oxidase-like protein